MSDPNGGGRARRVARQSGGSGASGGTNDDGGPPSARRSSRSTAAAAEAEDHRRLVAEAEHLMDTLVDESDGDDHDDDDDESSDEDGGDHDDDDHDDEEIGFGPDYDRHFQAERETDMLNLAVISERAQLEAGAAATAGGSRRVRRAGAGGGRAAARNGARITDPLRREQQQQQQSSQSVANADGSPVRDVAAPRRSARRGGASDWTASAVRATTSTGRSPTATSGANRREAPERARGADVRGAGSATRVGATPNATSRALARQENMNLVDAANLGPPTGIRNDEGAMTYYPPLPGGSGGGTGAGPGILTRGGGRNPATSRLARTVGAGSGAGGAGAGAADVPPRIIPPAHPAGFPGQVVGDWRDDGLGALPDLGPPPVPIGYAAYPLMGGAGGMGRFYPRADAGGARSVTTAAAALAGGSDVIDPTALLVACTRRFGSNFYPDPLVPYCGRRVGRNVVPSRDGTCSPLASSRGRVSTCPSCARLHDSLRLSRLRFMFGSASDIFASDVDSAINAKGDDSTPPACANPDVPVVRDGALVAALRSNSGQFAGTVSLLAKQLGVKPQPHPREVAYVARVLGLPETLARIALKKKDCDTTVTIGWICGFAGSGPIGTSPETSPMSICYQEALKEELQSSSSAAASMATEGSIDTARIAVDEKGLAALCSLCAEFNPSTQSQRKLSLSSSSCSSPSSRSHKKAGLKTTGQEEEIDDDKMMDNDNSDDDVPILLDGHCLVPAKNYAKDKREDVHRDGEEDRPLAESDRKILQSVFDAKINVPSPDPVLMKGLANIIAQSKEKRKGKEEGTGLKFLINELTPATQHKLFRYAMEVS